jgi:hypothetical protein
VGATRVRFGVLDRGGAAPTNGTPAAREGGRRGYCSWRAGARLVRWTGRRAMVEARGGEELASFAGAARD